MTNRPYSNALDAETTWNQHENGMAAATLAAGLYMHENVHYAPIGVLRSFIGPALAPYNENSIINGVLRTPE